MSWEMVIGDIPTHHLQECFIRAARAKLDDYPLTANAVNRAYQEMKPELLRQAQENAASQERLLMSGKGSLDRMTLDEWKTRHNLPPAWKLGDPFPPESDLYNKDVPAPLVEGYACRKCKGSGWTRIPYDAAHEYPAKLMPCSCQQKGGTQ